MSEKNITNLTGLHTSSNGFSAVPDGALVEAHNVVFLNKGVIEPRRGHEPLTISSYDDPDAMFFHDGRILYHSDDADNINLMATTEDSVSVVASSISAPDRANGRVKTVTADNRTYFTSTKGPYRLESVAVAPELAGAPRAADIYSVEATATDDGFLAAGYKCAYRVVFGKEDAQGNLILGAPSGRAFGYVAAADTSSRNMQLIFPVPSGMEEGDFYRVYRSEQQAFSGVNQIEPDDNLYLVLWKELSAAEISAEQVSVEDTTPEDFLGDALYTNSGEEGILQENSPPPVALDMSLWNERMWFANTKQEQRLEIQLLGVGEGQDGATGVRAHDIITIASRDYEAIVIGDTPTGGSQFDISDSADPAIAIEETARNLVVAINQNSLSSVSAYYLSGSDELPGKILLRAKEKGTSAFAVTLNCGPQVVEHLFREANVVAATFTYKHGLVVGDTFALTAASPHASFPVGTFTVASVVNDTQITYAQTGSDADEDVSYVITRTLPLPSFAWNPELPTSGTSASSDADEAPHRLYYSKLQQYEAVPYLNYIDVGVKDKDILRIYPLSDILVVFKEDGLYAVSGTTSSAVRCIDETVKLVAPDTVTKVSSKLFGLTNQGVISISQNGYDIVSKPIEDFFVRLVKLDADGFAALKRNSFAVARETDRLYILFPISTDLADETRKAWVFNVLLNTWTTWDPNTYLTGGVNPATDRLYFAGTGFFKERRTLTEADYCDGSVSKTVASTTATYIVINESITSQIYPGYVMEVTSGPSDGTFAVVTQVDFVNKYVYVAGTIPTLNAGNGLTFYEYFECSVKPNTVIGSSPNQGKQFREFKVHFKNKFNRTFSFTTTSDLDRAEQVVEVTDTSFEINDSVEWGVWSDPYVMRDLIPAEHQICTYLNCKFSVAEAHSYWQLNGFSLTYEVLSESTMR
jgi:hypothetical protein